MCEDGAERRKPGALAFPPSATRCRDQVNLTLTSGNGVLVAACVKKWEGRPLVGQIKKISTMKKICFQVGSHADPWYVLCQVTDKRDYATLEEMVRDLGKELLPDGPHEVQEAVSYYERLGKDYSQDDTRFCAFELRVMCWWCGRSSGSTEFLPLVPALFNRNKEPVSWYKRQRQAFDELFSDKPSTSSSSRSRSRRPRPDGDVGVACALSDSALQLIWGSNCSSFNTMVRSPILTPTTTFSILHLSSLR